MNFSGRVQGVGFRFKAMRLASMLRLKGFVRNEPDGSVTIEAEGKKAAIGELLRRLNSDAYIDITDVEITDLPLKETETAFDVKF